VTTEEIIDGNNAAVEEMSKKVVKPIIGNMAEKILFDLGALNLPARAWYKPKQYEQRAAHQGKREIARRNKRGFVSPAFVPNPSHPTQLVRPADIPSRQVLRRKARQEGLR